MRLEIYNFKCYRGKHNFTFSIKPTLLFGQSGAGKTTLLDCIYFALYGGTKVLSQGAKDGYVVLEMDQVYIKRSIPSDLVVTFKDENKNQSFIDEHFGKHFDLTGYVRQQNHKSFLYCSPQEKLEILESLLFERNPKEFRKKCSARIKSLQIEKSYDEGNLFALKDCANCSIPPMENKDSIMAEYQRLEIRQQLYTSFKLLTRDQVFEKPAYYNGETEEQLRDQIYMLKKIGGRKAWQTISKEETDEMIEDLLYQIKVAEARDRMLSLKVPEQTIDLTNVLSCPQCSVSLVYNEGTLVIPMSINKIQKYKKAKQEYESFNEPIEESCDTLRKALQWYEQYKKENTELDALQCSIELTSEQCHACLKYIASQNATNLLNEAKRIELRDYKSELNELRQQLEWIAKKERIIEYNAITKRIEQKQKQIISFEELAEMIKKTEIEYIMSFMNTINCRAQYYIQLFFEHTLNVELACENQKIQLYIKCKGIDLSFFQLSGGEQTRINLAYVLAFADTFGGKLLLLDECTSHLNSELAEKVTNILLKNKAKIIMVSHQVSSGMFEDVINVALP